MRILIICAVFALSLSPSAARDETEEPDSHPARISLVCLGAGSANRVTTGTVNVWDGDGDHAWANVVGNRTVPFEDQVNLWIESDEGRIRMPRAMLPTVRGGDNGWFKIKSIKTSDDEITGTVAVNFMNRPKLRIDRITGAISISGKAGDYSGFCSPYNPDTAQRAF